MSRWTAIRGQGCTNGELESLRVRLLNETEKEYTGRLSLWLVEHASQSVRSCIDESDGLLHIPQVSEASVTIVKRLDDSKLRPATYRAEARRKS
jgi:hypothetical protein